MKVSDAVLYCMSMICNSTEEVTETKFLWSTEKCGDFIVSVRRPKPEEKEES